MLPRRGANRRTRGERRTHVELFAPLRVPDGEGGWTEELRPLDPPIWRCSLEPATVRDLEAQTAGTIVAAADHILEGDYHPGISTESEIRYGSRTFYVSGVQNPAEQNIDTIVFAQEQLTAPPVTAARQRGGPTNADRAAARRTR
jgi:Phage head-tail joining protein